MFGAMSSCYSESWQCGMWEGRSMWYLRHTHSDCQMFFSQWGRRGLVSSGQPTCITHTHTQSRSDLSFFHQLSLHMRWLCMCLPKFTLLWMKVYSLWLSYLEQGTNTARVKRSWFRSDQLFLPFLSNTAFCYQWQQKLLLVRHLAHQLECSVNISVH